MGSKQKLLPLKKKKSDDERANAYQLMGQGIGPHL